MDDDLTAGEQYSAHLDGNVTGGALADAFGPALTTAIALCLGCGREEVVAEVRVYGAPMGLVARCSGCDLVLLGFTDLPTGRVLQMSGAALRFPAGS